MKRCKQCGTFYSESNAVCPKCGIELPYADDSAELGHQAINTEELRKQKIKSWILLAIGVPALIGFIYLVYFLIRTFTLEGI